jgi:hypothetical protein
LIAGYGDEGTANAPEACEKLLFVPISLLLTQGMLVGEPIWASATLRRFLRQ